MQIEFRPRAVAQLAEIFEYIAKDNRTAATSVVSRIEAVIDLLGEHPRMGKLIGYGSIRVMPVSSYPYLIYYRLTRNGLLILRIRHGARRRGKP